MRPLPFCPSLLRRPRVSPQQPNPPPIDSFCDPLMRAQRAIALVRRISPPPLRDRANSLLLTRAVSESAVQPIAATGTSSSRRSDSSISQRSSSRLLVTPLVRRTARRFRRCQWSSLGVSALLMTWRVFAVAGVWAARRKGEEEGAASRRRGGWLAWLSLVLRSCLSQRPWPCAGAHTGTLKRRSEKKEPADATGQSIDNAAASLRWPPERWSSMGRWLRWMSGSGTRVAPPSQRSDAQNGAERSRDEQGRAAGRAAGDDSRADRTERCRRSGASEGADDGQPHCSDCTALTRPPHCNLQTQRINAD